MDDLKPCPACGGPARLLFDSGVRGLISGSRWWRGFGSCKSKRCGFTGPVKSSPQKAIDKWNDRRPLEERP